MKKLYSFVLLLSLALAGVFAQGENSAKKLLDQVSAKVKTYKGITANFTFVSRSTSGAVNNNANGKIYIKGNKYYIKQGATEIFSDGIKTWNYNGDSEVTVTPADEDDQALTPQKFLTDFYDKDYTSKLVSSAGKYSLVQMVPNDKRKNFRKINLYIDKAKLMVTKARIWDKSNNVIDFTISNAITNALIPDNAFVFNKNKYKKNIEVIE